MERSRNTNETGSLPENLQGPALDGVSFSYIFILFYLIYLFYSVY